MTNVRVLHVVEATVGGIRKHVLQLLAGLTAHGVDAHVACPKVRLGPEAVASTFFEDATALGVPVHVLPMRREISPWRDIVAAARLAELARSEGFDVLHGHSSKGGYLARAVGRFAGLGTVYTPNGLAFLGDARPAFRRAYRTLERVAAPLTDRLIAVSQSEADQVLHYRLAAPERVIVIPNGVEAAPPPDAGVRRMVRAEFGIVDGTAVVVTTARLSAQKDPLTLLRAIADLRTAGKRVTLLWCGDGPLLLDCEATISDLQLGDSVRLLGARSDVPRILQAADAFVLASLFEGLPYALLEAMAAGLPVVATDVVGNRDLVTDGVSGLTVPPRTPGALAAALERLMDSPRLAERVGRAASAVVRDRYSASAMLARTASVYDAIR